MSSSDFDVLKAQKSDSITRYRSFIISRFCFRLSGAFSILCCSFTCFPYLQNIASDFLSDFNNQFFVFVLINALVFFIYRFSNSSSALNNDSASHRPIIYDQYVSLSSSNRKAIADEESRLVVQRNENISISHSKQTVRRENADCAPVEKTPNSELAVSTETYKTDREKKNIRRSRSEKIEKSDRRREVRRSETENGREMVMAGDDTQTRKSMQEMNNEEFRLTIESFIASKRKILRDDNLSVII